MPIYALVKTPDDGHPSKTSTKQHYTEKLILNLILPWAKPDLIDSSHKISFITSSLRGLVKSFVLSKDSDTSEDSEDSEDEDVSGPQKPGSRSIDEHLLKRRAHTKFLVSSLTRLPAKNWVLFDSMRPVMMYWIINSFSLLNLTFKLSDRLWAINLILSSQHPEGGFACRPGQIAHLADTFSSISALAILLGEAEPQLVKETWAQVKVEEMYHWMLRLKQPNGTFVMSQADIYMGERDVRAIYCALAVATLLNFLTPGLARGLPEFIAACQTYEGGLSSASQLVGIPTHSHRIPLGEAHGGYMSCGILSHFLLKSFEQSFSIVPLDYPACLRWLSLMQALPIEGGGFRGRTNKLVDGCYSWWCAGLFPVIATLIAEDGCVSEEIFEPHDRQSLQEYALLVSQLQSRTGGLRDGPSVAPDLYHTHYSLCGLSAAQHLHRFSPIQTKLREKEFDARSSSSPRFVLTEETIEQATNRARSIYSRALSWELRDKDCLVMGEPQNKLIPIDPVFNIRSKYVHTTMTHFYLRPV